MKRLEVGCGRKVTPGFVRADANPNVGALDWCGDVSTRMPWDDGTFDEIRAVDILEHIPYRRTAAALTEWARLLRPGGVLYVQVPDCGRIMAEWAQDPTRWRERLPADLAHLPPFLGVAWRILGGQDDGVITHDGDDPALNLHLSMFDEPTLRWYLTGAGFEVERLESNPHPNLLAWARRA